MGRKKTITDEMLITKIDEFYYRVCEGNAERLRIPEIGRYIRENDFPDVKDYVIRRSEAAMLHIKKLKEEEIGESISTVVLYKTIDASEFIQNNSNEKRLKQALTDLSLYYKKVAESATLINKKYKQLEENIKTTEKDKKKAFEELAIAEENVKNLKIQVKELTSNNKAMKTMIDTYVYPEIANELLKKTGFIKETQEIVNKDAIDLHLIKADTEIMSDNKVIQGLFDRFKG